MSKKVLILKCESCKNLLDTAWYPQNGATAQHLAKLHQIAEKRKRT